MNVIKWIFIFVIIFVLFCALYVYPLLLLIEWLHFCPGGTSGMSGRDCGYGIIWQWPLGTIVLSFISTTVFCSWLSSRPKLDDNSQPKNVENRPL